MGASIYPNKLYNIISAVNFTVDSKVMEHDYWLHLILNVGGNYEKRKDLFLENFCTINFEVKDESW